MASSASRDGGYAAGEGKAGKTESGMWSYLNYGLVIGAG